MAESGIQYALAQLSGVDTAVVTLDDAWAAIGDQGNQLVRVAGGGFRVQVTDASARVDLNEADEEQLERLPLTTEQIESLLDWREDGLVPRPEGAKDEYYNALATPYNARLGDFATVDELLLVRGFDAATLFEPQTDTVGLALSPGVAEEALPLYELLSVGAGSPNTTPDGAPKANANQATVQELVEAGLSDQLATAVVTRRNTVGTFTSWTSLLQTPGVNLQNVASLLDGVTLDTVDRALGRLNLNTASEAALRTVPGLDDDLVQAVLARQGTLESLGGIAAIPGMSIATIGQVAGRLTTGSDTFLVRALGRYGTRTVAIEAIVRIGEDVPKIVRTADYPAPNGPSRWGWETEHTSESVLVEEQ
jgi:general secretion pathway protein K